jgi:hypothetical protein
MQEEEVHPRQFLLPAGDRHDATTVALFKEDSLRVLH